LPQGKGLFFIAKHPLHTYTVAADIDFLPITIFTGYGQIALNICQFFIDFLPPE
jgi:hypothetical protein